MPRNTSPFAKGEREVNRLGGDDTQPTDRRRGTAAEDRECLPTIPVMPNFDRPETAVKKGGSGKRGETESYAEERSEGEA